MTITMIDDNHDTNENDLNNDHMNNISDHVKD